MVDSGTARSCVSRGFVDKLRVTTTPLGSADPPFLFTANQTQMPNLGIVELNISIQGLVIPFSFYVFEALAQNTILGVDFLQFSQAEICFNQRVISFYDGLISTNLVSAGSKPSLLLRAETVTIHHLRRH
jgi:hypothetical protein